MGVDGGLLERALGNIAQSKPKHPQKSGAIISVWEGFGRLLGVARSSKNQYFPVRGV